MPHTRAHKNLVLLCTALLFCQPAAASVRAYETCLQAYVNVTGYLGYAQPRAMQAELIAFDADFKSFIERGITRYGEAAVRSLVPDPEDSFIETATALHLVDGAEKTALRFLQMIAPCGGPNGELRAFFPA